MKPNILLLLTDDQRFDTIAALGNPHIATPHMDRLVARGAAFTHAHIPGGTSGAVCMPSRAMLHTGRGLFQIDGCGQRVPDEHTLLGEHLQAAGYYTFGTGKWHNGEKAFARSFRDGAEIFFGGMTDHWNVPAFDFDPSGRYDATCPVVDEPNKGKIVRERPGNHVRGGTHSSELISTALVDFLASYAGNAPFFAYGAYLAPHDPRTMPKAFRAQYRDEDIPLPESFVPRHPFDLGVHGIRDEVLAPQPRTEADMLAHQADYYAMITHLDAQIGRVLAALEARGELDNTLVVFAGDNGLAVGRHGLLGKQNLYEHATRVPLLIAGPGVPAGVRSDALVYLLDIFPTLCELADVPVPASVTGDSLVPCIRDGAPGRDALYLAYTELHRAVRTRTHKWIEVRAAGERHVQLFDLDADPHELHDRSEDPDCAAVRAELEAALLTQRDASGDLDSTWGQRFWHVESA